MLVFIVICVIVGLWIWKREAKNSKNLVKEFFGVRYQDEDDRNEEKLQKEIILEDINQQAMQLYNTDEMLKLKNKDFVFKCLSILHQKNRKEDIAKLTDVDFCKNNFNMYYAILQEIKFDINNEQIFMDNCGHRRYYPNVITLFDKKYIVCNDWFYNNKSNPRDTRTPFIHWVLQ